MPYISKVDTAQKIYAEELRKIGASADKWKDFLDFSAKSNLSDNQGMSEFSSKVVIHAYNPNAVDCRTYDDWKQQEGNHVSRGQHGIPVLTRDSSGKVRVAHVFDTGQTAQKRLPEKPELSESAKERLAVSLQAEIRKFANNPRFSNEQKRLFSETAEYKLSKQYGLKTNEDTERFFGIEKLSVNEKAFIGIALNGCSRSFAQIVNNERRMSNEREYDSKSRDDRQGLRGREQRGMDLDSGRTSNAHEEIRLPNGNGNVGQTEHGTRDIRADVLGSRTEAHSGNGQVRQSAAEIHMADTAPNGSHNAGRGTGDRHGEVEPSLRGNERKSPESDRGYSGKEEAVSGVQGIGGNREISSESADVGAVQNGSGGGNTSRDGVRNITDETAEPEKVSAVSDLSDNENSNEYPYVTVKGGRNYDLLIAPELEEKDYSVAEFNSALGKLNERWDDEEYEGRTAFVTLTIHLNEAETFEKRLYAEYQFDSLSERLEFDDDIFDKEVKLRQAVREAENKAEDKQEAPEYTGIEKAFLNSDTAAFMAKAVLSWDEIESIGYRLFEKGYNDRYSPSEKAIFGNGMREPELYETAKKMQSGEDIRKELSSALLGSQTNFRTERGNEFAAQYGDEYITARYGNAEKQISYEDMGNAFLKLIEDEHNNIVHGRTVEDLQYVIPDLNSETAEKLVTAFDNAARPDWENNFQKQQDIKRGLNGILGDEELTVKAFNSIADMKYNYKPEPVKEDNLEFHFGRGKEDDWISESDLVYDFALANPDCSFALGNAVLEYLDEKQHAERNIPELKSGWYKKTDFDITATVGGEDFHYEGRFDIGDGKGTGGGSLIDHIRDLNKSIIDTDEFPYNTPEAKEQAKNTLEILVPFLEKNAVLTEKEQEILEDFKAANPIRSYEDIEKETPVEAVEEKADEIISDMPETVSVGDKFRNKTTGEISEVVSLTGALPWYTDDCTVKKESAAPTVADLSVGDVILYEGKRREIEELDDRHISLKDLDAPDFGGILLGTSDVLAYDSWQEDMNTRGFEILSKAEPEIILNVGDVIKIPADKESPEEIPEEYGVVEAVSDNKLKLGLYSPNDTAFTSKYGTADCDKEYFFAEHELEYIGSIDELRKADYEQNREIYEALKAHNIIHLFDKAKEKTLKEFMVENGRKMKFGNLRIEYNEKEDGELDKGYILKGDTEKAKDLVLFCYGELSPESMYHSIKADGYMVESIEKPEHNKEIYKGISDDDRSFDRDKFIDKVVTSAVEHFRNEPSLKAIYEDKDGSYVLQNGSLAAASQTEKLNVAFSLKFDSYVMNALRGEIPEFQRDEDITPLRSVFNGFREDRGLVESVHSAFTQKLIKAFEEPQTVKSADKNEINNFDSFNENAVKYAFNKITEEHNYDFTNPTFMYLGHLQDYMIDHKINDIVVGATSDTMRNYYGNAPLTNEYFSTDYTFSRDLPEEYNKYFHEYISSEKSVEKSKADGLDGQAAQNGKKEIPDKITFEVFGGGAVYFRDKEMNDLAKVSSDGIKYYTELSENDKKKITDRAKELQNILKKDVQKLEFEPDPVGEQLELFHVEEERPYQIITYDSDTLSDDKEDYPTLKEALKNANEYLKNGYDGYAVYNKNTQTIEETAGYFPSEKVFSVDVLLKNGVITPEQEPDMIKGLEEEAVRDKVISELLKSESLKKSAENNIREDFAFPYYEAVNTALVDMLDSNPTYAAQKEISYLLDDEDYLHNVFGDYDTVLQQLVPENANDERVTVTHSDRETSAEKETLTSDNNISVSTSKMQPLDFTDIDKTVHSPEKNYFRITDEHLGEGSKREKYMNNISAIMTLKQLEDEERHATPEEQETLSKYIGWGGLQEAFDSSETSWSNEYYQLKELLTDEEYKAARATVNDAFYTSPVIINAIYEGLSNIGFKGGEVLEPSMGVGNFFGTMPDSMRNNSNLSGVEIDSISGRIAQKLYPEANIAINGFEKVKPSKGAFDLAVGNVPFGNHGVPDNTKAYKGLLIHDYFFAKSLDSVRSGGVVAFVTSTGTLDKEDTTVRQMLAQKAELMGAVRLPNNAFQKNAGTPTTTDIIFLKKREKPLNISEMAADKSCDWVHTKINADGYKINSYFADNPEMVLGDLSDKGNFGSIICTPVQGADLKEQLHEAMKNIKGEYVPLEFQAELDERAEENYLPATPDIENLTYTVVDDKLYFRVDDDLIPLKESEQHGAIADRRKAMCSLGETTRELLKAQVEDKPDIEIKLLQAELNTKYDFFVKKFGRINPIETQSKTNASGVSRKAANSNAFKNDVRLPLLQSLEKMKEGQFIGKAEIFTERTIRPRQLAEHVETAQEALILSMSEKGKVDFGYMEKLTGFDQKKLVNDLHGEIFPVPYSLNEYQTADEYLSGNIYKKIAQAEECITGNPAFAENVAALKQVIPTPLKATEIDMQLGMTWIDPKIIQQFMYEKFDTPYRFQEYKNTDMNKNPSAITVSFSGAGKGAWKIENARLDNSVKSTKNFGTKDFNAYELLEKILNSKSVAVTDTYRDSEGKTKTVILEKETKVAEDKVKLINAEFKKWIFADPERRNELVKTYNEKFNCIRPREYDGSHLNFFGSNPEIALKPHQKNAVAHALFGGNTLFAHEVGAGKTFEMIATAMEGKRLGLHTKSMFVVPNHLTEQIGSDFMKLYPNANILVAKPDDFSPQKRRQMCARIATGNFDAVIIGHSQLIKIPLSAKREKEFLENQIDDIVVSLAAAKMADGESYTIKQLEATRKKLQERLERLTNSTVKDNAVTFEELGVDKLFVDEAHEFKNLYVSTKMENVSGLSTNADVQKTQDLYMKCQYLDEKTGSKGIVFSTGTPVTNALSEMFTMQKYLQSDLLKETGLDSFDSWAGNFTRKSTETEISPSGSDWREKTRLKFTNVPELVTMFKECADIKMADQLNLDVPECSKNIVSVEPTQTQKAVVQSLGERAEKISSGAVSRTVDNMLMVTGDGRKLGLDQRLFDLNLPDEPQSKLNACVNNVHDIWASTVDKKSTQLIFCDLGVPQSKEDLKKNGERFDVYADIRKKLIDKGIPEKEIAFIHDANSETEKAKLFAKVRSGDVRVLIGSTQKMGAGTNVQNKLIALHDLDCPWRPADLTQRLGRMVRQGNENDRVHNFRYVTKGTFDAYLYQMVEKKQKSISQIFTSKAISRTCDDIDDMAVDFMQVKMAAVGDDRIRRQMELHEDIRGLNMLRNTYLENKYELEDNIRELPKKIEKAEKLVENIADDVKKIENYKAPRDIDGKEIYKMKIGGETFTDKKQAGEAFMSAMTTAIAKNPKNPTEIAEYKGFKIAVSYNPFTRVHHGTLKGAADYPFELGNSESGNLTRIDNVIASVSKRTDIVCNDIERMKNELADSINEINAPFSHEAELTEKKQELDRLTEEIESDKLNGKIAPEQPENTSESKDSLSENQSEKHMNNRDMPDEKQTEKPVENTNAVPEKQTNNSEVIMENTTQKSVEKSSENISEKNTATENIQQPKKDDIQAVRSKKDVPEEKPETLNIKWVQSGKAIKISFNSSAENPITAFADGKATGACKPEELVVTKIPDNEKKHYPVGITHCVKPLNIAFGSNIAEHIKKFADKVKEICNKIKGKEKTLFSRDMIMSDKYKPMSSKDDKKQQNEHSQSM